MSKFANPVIAAAPGDGGREGAARWRGAAIVPRQHAAEALQARKPAAGGAANALGDAGDLRLPPQEDGSALGASEEPAAMSRYRHSSAQHSHTVSPIPLSSIDASQIQTELEEMRVLRTTNSSCVRVSPSGRDGRCAFLP